MKGGSGHLSIAARIFSGAPDTPSAAKSFCTAADRTQCQAKAIPTMLPALCSYSVSCQAKQS